MTTEEINKIIIQNHKMKEVLKSISSEMKSIAAEINKFLKDLK